MRAQERLTVLLDQGAIQEIVRPLMSGKEAEVYLVISDDELRVAKLYKSAHNRSFKHRSEYTEGRKTRNSRSERAMGKRSKFGREQEEEAWRNAEVDVIYRLAAAGVRVPQPHVFMDGVLVMELIRDFDGNPAPRLCDITLDKREALEVFHILLKDVQRMLCAGVVHGDLSDFNVLMSPEGPVIIDFPQAVDPAHNRNAQKLLIRDVKNLTSFLARWAPSLRKTRYAEEMWALYEKNDLSPETKLTGRFKGSSRKADTASVLDEIASAAKAEYERRVALGLEMPRDLEEREQEKERARELQIRAKSGRRAEKSAKTRGQQAPRERTQGRGKRGTRDGRPDLRKRGDAQDQRGGQEPRRGRRRDERSARRDERPALRGGHQNERRGRAPRDERPDLRTRGDAQREQPRRSGSNRGRRDARPDLRQSGQGGRPDLRQRRDGDRRQAERSRDGRRAERNHDRRRDERSRDGRRDERSDGRRDGRRDERRDSRQQPRAEQDSWRGGDQRRADQRPSRSPPLVEHRPRRDAAEAPAPNTRRRRKPRK